MLFRSLSTVMVQAIGLALLVLFFVVGVMRTCGNFAEVKRPEQALKLFIRFAIAKGAVTYGLELMMALFKIVQGMISTIMNAAGFGSAQQTVLPQEIVTAVEDCGFFESIPLWAVTLIGGLFITVLSFIMIMSVYGRFFKLYIYTAIAPVPLSAFAGEPSQSVGKSFINSIDLYYIRKDDKMSTQWIRCPVCNNKNRGRIREDTILINYPLYCPKCKQETLIKVKKFQVTVIKELDAQTQSR